MRVFAATSSVDQTQGGCSGSAWEECAKFWRDGGGKQREKGEKERKNKRKRYIGGSTRKERSSERMNERGEEGRRRRTGEEGKRK